MRFHTFQNYSCVTICLPHYPMQLCVYEIILLPIKNGIDLINGSKFANHYIFNQLYV